jgi:hypothetical protein
MLSVSYAEKPLKKPVVTMSYPLNRKPASSGIASKLKPVIYTGSGIRMIEGRDWAKNRFPEPEPNRKGKERIKSMLRFVMVDKIPLWVRIFGAKYQMPNNIKAYRFFSLVYISNNDPLIIAYRRYRAAMDKLHTPGPQ